MVNVIDLPAMVLILLEREKPEPDHCITLCSVINGETAIFKILAHSPNITQTQQWECYSVFLTIIDEEYKILHQTEISEAVPFVTSYLNLPETEIKSSIMDFLHNPKSHLRN